MNESAWITLLAAVSLKSTAVLLMAWLVAATLRGRSASARHLVWTASAIAVLLLPLLSIALPAWPVPFTKLLPGEIQFHATASTTNPSPALRGPVRASASQALPQSPLQFGWPLPILLIWVLGVAFAVLKMLIAIQRMWLVRRAAAPAPYRQLTAELAQELGVSRLVEVLTTSRGTMPMAVGVLRPAVLLPADAAEWSDDRLRIVLAHEIAHVRRRDMALQIIARLALALNWWNPLAWIAWRELIRERELATDDLVLRIGARPTDYASHLLDVARETIPVDRWASVAMARRSHLESRVTAILDAKVDRTAAGRIFATAAFLVTLAVVLPLAALHAQSNLPSAMPADVNATIRAARAQKNPKMIEDAAALFASSRDYDTAQKLLEAASTIHEEVSGKRSTGYGLSLIKLGDLKGRRGLADEAAAFYTQAAQVLGERQEAAPALIHLGVAAARKKEFPQATAYFEQARTVNPEQAGAAVMWMAVVQQRQGNLDEAETQFRNALSLMKPASAESAMASKLYANFLRAQGRDEEAKGLDSRTAPAIKPKLTASTGVYRSGGDVKAPSLLQKVEPEYTDEARVAFLSGTEVLSVEIGVDGLAHNPQVLQSLGFGLDEKGIEAVSQWRFKPGTRNGEPVTVLATIEINWRLM